MAETKEKQNKYLLSCYRRRKSRQPQEKNPGARLAKTNSTHLKNMTPGPSFKLMKQQ